ncbi:MAG TPA: hypothetical protein VI318_15935 [Baekduia sp.]
MLSEEAVGANALAARPDRSLGWPTPEDQQALAKRDPALAAVSYFTGAKVTGLA